MAIHIAGMSLPGPSDVLDAVRAVTGWGAETTELLAGLPARASRLLDEAERLVRHINDVADRADRLVDKVDAVANGANQVAGRAAGLIAEAGDLSRNAGELLTIYQPLASEAAPLVKRFVEELSEGEIVAAIRLVDQLPALALSLESQIMPILGTLDHVGPDMNELLKVVKDLRKAIDGVPGLGMLRRWNSSPATPEPPGPGPAGG
jgi:hypothetical protein